MSETSCVSGGVSESRLEACDNDDGTLKIEDRENPLPLEILSAPPSVYSHNPDEPIIAHPRATSKNTVLIADLQTRNNAGVIFSTAIDF
jgi:hypothetical protein